MAEQREYWAFISYRHLDNKEPGREWATWIAREIETYKVPADLVGTKNERGDSIPERIYPVFRDEDELSAGADLNSPIYQALQQSKSLIVICSPRAIKSRYVGNEISYYKTLDRASGALAMMIEGEPHSGDDRECFPKELKHPVDADGQLDTSQNVEPIAADFRLPDGNQGWHGLEQCRKNLADATAVEHYRERCELAKLKIIAGIIGVPLGQLVERDKAYQLALAKKRTRTIGRVAAVMAALAVAAAIAGVVAWQQRERAIESQHATEKALDTAEQTRDAAEDLVGEIIFNLRDKLEPIGQLELLDDSTVAAENYFAKLPPSMVTSETERRRSVVFETRAKILRATGDLNAALQSYQEGLKIARRLAAGKDADVKHQQELVISLREIADVLFAQNQPDQARKYLTEAETLIFDELGTALGHDNAAELVAFLNGDNGEKLQSDGIVLVSDSPSIADLFASAAVVTQRLGDIAHLTGDVPGALERYQTALNMQQAMGVAQPDRDYWRRQQVSGHNKIGNVHLINGDLKAARAAFQKHADLTKAELSREPDNAFWLRSQAASLERLSAVDVSEKKFQDALEKAQRAKTIFSQLAENDPTNLSRQRSLYVGLHKLGLSLKAAGEPADAIFDEARVIARRLVAEDPTNATWRRDLAFSLDTLAIRQRNAGDQEAALKTTTEAVGHHRILSEGDPDNLQFRLNLQIAINGLAINHWALEDLDAALKNFKLSARLAAQTMDDLVEPTLKSHKELGDICVYIAQVAEQAKRRDEAVSWYKKALKVALAARELELIGEEVEAKSIQPLRKRITELEAKGGANL